jgi:putative DNA-invertase from lambdoid prophage Rac
VQVFREQESAARRRPVFDTMMRDARSKSFRHLIIWRVDRFGRRMQGNINDVLELDRAGVDVVSVKEPWLAAGGPARNLLLAIFSWLAEEERRILIERVKAGMERARKSGKQCGRAPVSPAVVIAAAEAVRQGVPLGTAARKLHLGTVPVRKHLALEAAERVRSGASVRAVSREYHLGIDTIRRVLAGTSYLNRYPDRARAEVPRIRETYLSFDAARAFARALGLKSKAEWLAWCGGGSYQLALPVTPQYFYREAWRGWPDWLGYVPRLPFEEARTFARGLRLHSENEWRAWCRGGRRPRNVPYEPGLAYPGEFQGWPDWLGYERRNFRGQMLMFSEAREKVRRLGLRSAKEYQAWAASAARDRRIASKPDRTYASDWLGWSHWLGYPPRRLLPFRRAREEARKLKLRSRREWIAWTQSGMRPKSIPSRPEHAYPTYWRGFADWLGYPKTRKWPFFKARKYVRGLGIRSCSQWQAWARTPARPPFIPSDPPKSYRPHWRGWRDWLRGPE